MRRRWIVFVFAAIFIAASLFACNGANRESIVARPMGGVSAESSWMDAEFSPASVPGSALPLAGLAPIGAALMHGDAYQSDTHPAAGPIGGALEVRTRRAGGWMPRQCATFLFRADGKVVAMCGGLTGFRLVLLDPGSLEALATFDLPMRPSAFQAIVRRDLDIVFGDSSGGAYLFLDDAERVVFADARQRIRRVRAEESGGRWSFVVEDSWDMGAHVPHDCLHYDNWLPSGECDAITTVMPDGQGRLWWVTRMGRIGALDPRTGESRQVNLDGEEIQNAVAVDGRAIYVLSDHAQYAFTAGPDGAPVQLWRHPYDRGTQRKVGSINQGSGTTPTLIGDRYITFADNAEPRINIVVLRRGEIRSEEAREICRVPVFAPGASATDNSMIGWGRSIILENNAGYTHARGQDDWSSIAGGVVRVDIREDETGCDVVWTSPLASPSVVPKLSTATGVAYFYSFVAAANGDVDWAVVGLDFRTGREVVRVPTGRGVSFDNNWSSIAISPAGDLYVGAATGLIQVRPRPTP
jgi:hypothetical protein